MENRYYTPDITEFRVGFEYEYLSEGLFEEDIDGIYGWYKAVFTLAIEEEEQKHPTKQVRVKYLDKTDLEELGFELCPRGTYYENDEGFVIYNQEENQRVEIYGWEDDSHIFVGKIKNKSELKMILNMIGI